MKIRTPCQSNKWENVLQLLPKSEYATWHWMFKTASKPFYSEASASLFQIYTEIHLVDESGFWSRDEGARQTPMLHHLGVFLILGVGLRTMSCLESLNKLVAASGPLKATAATWLDLGLYSFVANWNRALCAVSVRR